MEIGAKGSRKFIRVMRLAGIPEAEKNIIILQKGVASAAKKRVIVAWEA
jgi:hypothetical protein